MSKQSAGLLLYRKNKNIEVLIGHPGGPFFAKKDKGSWSIIKGEFEGEAALEAAKREFQEETGTQAPEGACIEIGSVKTKGGKTIYAWAVEADIDAANLISNNFTIEWPPRSGHKQEFPEIDKFLWLPLAEAKVKLSEAQAEFIDRLAEHLGVSIEDQKTDQPQQASLL